MNKPPFSPTPSLTRVLQPPDVWLLMKTLGVITADVETPPEFTGGEGGEEATRDRLLEQGLLEQTKKGKLRLGGEAESLILPAVLPEMAIVANVSDTEREGGNVQLICFNWTRETVVVNWVDAENDHHFEAYEPDLLNGCVLDHLARSGALEVDDQGEATQLSSIDDLEQVAAHMRRMTSLLAVLGLRREQQIARSMGWFISNGSAWVMRSRPEEGGADFAAATAAGLALSVFEFVEEVLTEVESDLVVASPR